MSNYIIIVKNISELIQRFCLIINYQFKKYRLEAMIFSLFLIVRNKYRFL